ncbi:MAG: TIGR02452 family protein [Planctomycetota bacterium]
MSRKARKQIAEETLRIIAAGAYITQAGARVRIAREIEAAVQGTELIRPDDFDELQLHEQNYETEVEVYNETTFAGAKALLDDGAEEVCSLNFASAKNPGGGFLGGSQAQEEALARASALYECLLRTPEYYEFHRSDSLNGLYSHHMVYSLKVPVFRDDADRLLDEPWLTSIITSPAVNAGAVMKNAPHNAKRIEPIMSERIERVLLLAAARGEKNLVLGAWGCGVFRNDPKVIASLFKDAIKSERLRGLFAKVRFSVLDRSEKTTTLDAFRKVL